MQHYTLIAIFALAYVFMNVASVIKLLDFSRSDTPRLPNLQMRNSRNQVYKTYFQLSQQHTVTLDIGTDYLTSRINVFG